MANAKCFGIYHFTAAVHSAPKTKSNVRSHHYSRSPEKKKKKKKHKHQQEYVFKLNHL